MPETLIHRKRCPSKLPKRTLNLIGKFIEQDYKHPEDSERGLHQTCLAIMPKLRRECEKKRLVPPDYRTVYRYAELSLEQRVRKLPGPTRHLMHNFIEQKYKYPAGKSLRPTLPAIWAKLTRACEANNLVTPDYRTFCLYADGRLPKSYSRNVSKPSPAENIAGSNADIFRVPYSGSVVQDHMEHISRLGLRRLDFEHFKSAGNAIYFIEGDWGRISEEDETARIASLAYALKKLGNKADASEFHRCLNIICDGGDALYRQGAAKHYYAEIEEHGVSEVLKAMDLLAIEMDKLNPDKWKTEGDDKYVPITRRTSSSGSRLFDSEVREKEKMIRGRRKTTRNPYDDHDKWVEYLVSAGASCDEVDDALDPALVTAQYYENGAILVMSAHERTRVCGHVSDLEVSADDLPEQASHLAVYLRQAYINGVEIDEIMDEIGDELRAIFPVSGRTISRPSSKKDLVWEYRRLSAKISGIERHQKDLREALAAREEHSQRSVALADGIEFSKFIKRNRPAGLDNQAQVSEPSERLCLEDAPPAAATTIRDLEKTEGVNGETLRGVLIELRHSLRSDQWLLFSDESKAGEHLEKLRCEVGLMATDATHCVGYYYGFNIYLQRYQGHAGKYRHLTEAYLSLPDREVGPRPGYRMIRYRFDFGKSGKEALYSIAAKIDNLDSYLERDNRELVESKEMQAAIRMALSGVPDQEFDFWEERRYFSRANIELQRRFRDKLEDLLDEFSQDYHLSAMRRNKIYREYYLAIRRADDICDLSQIMQDAYDDKEAKRLSLKELTLLKTAKVLQVERLMNAPLSELARRLIWEINNASFAKLRYLAWKFYGQNDPEHPIHQLRSQEISRIWTALKARKHTIVQQRVAVVMALGYRAADAFCAEAEILFDILWKAMESDGPDSAYRRLAIIVNLYLPETEALYALTNILFDILKATLSYYRSMIPVARPKLRSEDHRQVKVTVWYVNEEDHLRLCG